MHNKRNVIIISVVVGLACRAVKAASDESMEVFASVVAKSGASFTTVAKILKPDEGDMNAAKWDSQCLGFANNFTALSVCDKKYSKTRMSFEDVNQLYIFARNQNLSEKDVVGVSPALIYWVLSCESWKQSNLAASDNATVHSTRPSAEAMWGYSFLCVTLINLCSLTGAVVLPCMKMKIYKLVLMFMVGLAVGTLAGSALLFLIPEAFLIVHDDSSDYVWKSTTILGGIYLFYLTEKIMRMINRRRENTSAKKQKDEWATKNIISTSFRPIPIDNSIPGRDPVLVAENFDGICSNDWNSQSSGISTQNSFRDNISIISNGGTNKQEDKKISGLNQQPGEIAPVAYMIVFGDALHNFIDGLSIGSAFTQSILAGVSVSVAVVCEELPHELGDFAVLLNSGMSVRKALLSNFLSACTCYIGTIVGILVAENVAAHEWIFAVAGGMFLYISLVDMMPEMNTTAESEEGRQFGEMKIFIIQNCGLLTGFGVMLIFAWFGGNINFD